MEAHDTGEQDRFRVIDAEDGSRALHSGLAYATGDPIVTFSIAARVPQPTRHSIQLGVSDHALIEPESLRLMNHSCDPNVALDARSLALRAIRPIEPGEELTYFYPSTEWEMAEPFTCSCGTPRCVRRIAGAAHLPAETLTRYDLADHIRLLLEQRRGRPAAPDETTGRGLARADAKPIVWALIPYSIEGDRLTASTFDSEVTKNELAETFQTMGLPWIWQPVVLGSMAEVIQQLVASSKQRPTVAFNFCDGLDWDGIPGLSFVKALESSHIPFTGSDSRFYEISTFKLRMKDLFRQRGVATAPWELVPDGPVYGLCERLGVPLLVKPEVSFASTGISLRSKVFSDAEIAARRDELRRGSDAATFVKGEVFVERYLAGEEYTVFVGGYWDRPSGIWTLPPAQRCFAESIPLEERFLTYDRYWGYFIEESRPADGEEFYHYQLVEARLAPELVDLAKRAYCAVHGHSYARVDIRRDTVDEHLSVLEVNGNCGLSGDDQTSTGSILRLMGWDLGGLLRRIIDETLERWETLDHGAGLTPDAPLLGAPGGP